MLADEDNCILHKILIDIDVNILNVQIAQRDICHSHVVMTYDSTISTEASYAYQSKESRDIHRMWCVGEKEGVKLLFSLPHVAKLQFCSFSSGRIFEDRYHVVSSLPRKSCLYK